jgi:hypothetical protein
MSKAIVDEVVALARRYVINQSRYQTPTGLISIELWDKMYTYADTEMTDESTLPFLEGKAILSHEKLVALVEKIGVEALYDGDAWVDLVAEYIVENRADCMELWATIAREAI